MNDKNNLTIANYFSNFIQLNRLPNPICSLIMNKMTNQQIEKKLTEYFAGRPYVAFGYLFGSRAKNTITPLSDIDIAAYIQIEKASENLFDLRLQELTALFDLLKTENIDLVFLNETPLELSYKILKHGKLLYERDSLQRVTFTEETIRNYLDRKHFIDDRNKIIRQKMLEGSYFD